MALDLSSLKKAVDAFERTVKVERAAKPDKDLKEALRSGVIQHFEFTYELCWKFIKRWLEINGEGSAVDGMSKKELFRIAAERQLIGDPQKWFEYHKARNETTHICDEDIAREVYQTALLFLKEAKDLLAYLEAKND